MTFKNRSDKAYCLGCGSMSFSLKDTIIKRGPQKIPSVAWHCDTCNEPLESDHFMRHELHSIVKQQERSWV